MFEKNCLITNLSISILKKIKSLFTRIGSVIPHKLDRERMEKVQARRNRELNDVAAENGLFFSPSAIGYTACPSPLPAPGAVLMLPLPSSRTSIPKTPITAEPSYQLLVVARPLEHTPPRQHCLAGLSTSQPIVFFSRNKLASVTSQQQASNIFFTTNQHQLPATAS